MLGRQGVVPAAQDAPGFPPKGNLVIGFQVEGSRTMPMSTKFFSSRSRFSVLSPARIWKWMLGAVSWKAAMRSDSSVAPETSVVHKRMVPYWAGPSCPSCCWVFSMSWRISAPAWRSGLLRQLKLAGCEERAELPFQKAILENDLPFTIGGGIGQSRLCMLMIGCCHIGEVQVSLWDEDTMAACDASGIILL